MSLGHHGNIGTAYGLEAVTPETERTTATTAAFGDRELQLPTVTFTHTHTHTHTHTYTYRQVFSSGSEKIEKLYLAT